MAIDFGLTDVATMRDVPAVVERVLDAAEMHRASDAHVEPHADGVSVRFRIDGVLQPAVELPKDLSANIVARLKVLAELLTYRLDVPQEGGATRPGKAPLRISTFPTIHGEKVVVRFFADGAARQQLDDLGFDTATLARLTSQLGNHSGAVLLTGPSGSGKTTTAYACLNHILRTMPGRNIMTVEDPVERTLPGITQSQVKPGGEFDFARGLRSLLRQDPEVILVGEIRDRETAAIACEASLTGHLVLSTLHAGSTHGAISRLLDMGIEPYLLTSGLRCVVNQRLLRKRCCASGCGSCAGSGYRGRVLAAEILVPDTAMKSAILARADVDALQAAQAAEPSLHSAAAALIASGVTDEAEVRRVMGDIKLPATRNEHTKGTS